jgi:hypothetical protein
MKIRAVLTVLVCNTLAFLLMSVAGFLIVRFAPWGHMAADLTRLQPAQLAAKYGNPVALLQRGVFYQIWILGPCFALALGAVAAVMFGRCDWRISTLSVVILVVASAAPTSLAGSLAACLYIVASWLAMKLVSMWLPPSASRPSG